MLSGSSQTDHVTDLLNNLEELQEYGHVRMVISDNDTDNNNAMIDIIAFATRPMVALFHKFPEVIYMDGKWTFETFYVFRIL